MHGNPACIRNAGEFGWPNIWGNAMCGGGSDGVWLVICLGYWGVAGCVLQLWRLACSRRAFMVSVGVGRLLNLFCMIELGAMFWQHRVVLEAPEPQDGSSRVISGPSQSWMCGCSLAHGVFMSM